MAAEGSPGLLWTGLLVSAVGAAAAGANGLEMPTPPDSWDKSYLVPAVIATIGLATFVRGLAAEGTARQILGALVCLAGTFFLVALTAGTGGEGASPPDRIAASMLALVAGVIGVAMGPVEYEDG